MTERQRANLKRGSGTDPAIPTRAKRERKERDDRLEATPDDDPATCSNSSAPRPTVLSLLRQWQAKGGDPPTNLIEAARECRQYAVDCLNLGVGGDQQSEQERIFGVLEVAFGDALEDVDVYTEPHAPATRDGKPWPILEREPEPLTPASIDAGDRTPREILRLLRAALKPAVARCAERLGKGEPQTSKATAALKEFRLLSSTIREVNASTADDSALDRLVGEIPERMARTEARLDGAFIPPLEPPARSVADVSNSEDDVEGERGQQPL